MQFEISRGGYQRLIGPDTYLFPFSFKLRPINATPLLGGRQLCTLVTVACEPRFRWSRAAESGNPRYLSPVLSMDADRRAPDHVSSCFFWKTTPRLSDTEEEQRSKVPWSLRLLAPLSSRLTLGSNCQKMHAKTGTYPASGPIETSLLVRQLFPPR